MNAAAPLICSNSLFVRGDKFVFFHPFCWLRQFSVVISTGKNGEMNKATLPSL